MKQLLFWISIVIILAVWPLSFYLANTASWQPFFLAIMCLVAGLVLFFKKSPLFPFVFLALPFIHPAFLAFPVIFILFFLKESKKLHLLIYGIGLLVTFFLNFKTFYAYSIFTPDPLAFDTLVKKISLIPNRNLARIYENKTTIYQGKFVQNVFTSLDPNNYFFAMHPQEKGDSQNLNKFSFLSVIPFIFGIYYLPHSRHRKTLLAVLSAAILSVALINNQDRYDSVIYVPITWLILSGLTEIKKSKWFNIFSFVFIVSSVYELLRVFFIKP